MRPSPSLAADLLRRRQCAVERRDAVRAALAAGRAGSVRPRARWTAAGGLEAAAGALPAHAADGRVRRVVLVHRGETGLAGRTGAARRAGRVRVLVPLHLG
jgi:hypothetical protein